MRNVYCGKLVYVCGYLGIEVSIFLLSVLLTITVFYLVARVAVGRRFGAWEYVLSWYLVIYCVSPIYMQLTDSGTWSLYDSEYMHSHSSLAAIYIAIGLISLSIGYFVANELPVSRLRVVCVSNANSFPSVVYLLVFVALLSFSVFVVSYGGLDYVVSNISKIRTGVDERKNYFGAFVRMFVFYAELALFIAYAYLERGRSGGVRGQYLLKVMIGALFLVVVFKLYLDGGRAGFIELFIGLYFLSVFYSRKINVFAIFFILAGCVVFVLFGKTLIFQLSNPSFDYSSWYSSHDLYIVDGVMREFSHQYLSLVMSLDGMYESRLFGDYWYWLFKWMRLFSMDAPDSISYFNTYLATGVWESDIPPGVLAFSIFNGGAMLLPVHMVLLGGLVRVVEKLFLHEEYGSHPVVLSLGAVSVVNLDYFITNADPALIVQTNIPIIVFFLLFLFFGKIKFVLLRPSGGFSK